MLKSTLTELLITFKKQDSLDNIYFRLDDYGKVCNIGDQDYLSIDNTQGGFMYMYDTIKLVKGTNIHNILTDIIIKNHSKIIINIINVQIVDRQYNVTYSVFHWE